MSSVIQKYKKLKYELDTAKKCLKLDLVLLHTEVTKRKDWKKKLSQDLTIEYNTGTLTDNINILKSLIKNSTVEINNYLNSCYKSKRRIKAISAQMSNLIK